MSGKFLNSMILEEANVTFLSTAKKEGCQAKTLFILDIARTCYPPFLSSHDPFYWNKTVANEKKHAIREQPNKYGKQPNNYGKKQTNMANN